MCHVLYVSFPKQKKKAEQTAQALTQVNGTARVAEQHVSGVLQQSCTAVRSTGTQRTGNPSQNHDNVCMRVLVLQASQGEQQPDRAASPVMSDDALLLAPLLEEEDDTGTMQTDNTQLQLMEDGGQVTTADTSTPQLPGPRDGPGWQQQEMGVSDGKTVALPHQAMSFIVP